MVIIVRADLTFNDCCSQCEPSAITETCVVCLSFFSPLSSLFASAVSALKNPPTLPSVFITPEEITALISHLQIFRGGDSDAADSLDRPTDRQTVTRTDGEAKFLHIHFRRLRSPHTFPARHCQNRRLQSM